MALAKVSLEDKYVLESGRIYLSGTQALVRLPMIQKRRDEAAGLNTGSFITGYRGSPLGALDQELWRAKKFLSKHNIRFQAGVNEDLAATAIWGSQQVGLHGDATVDGVFSMWYAKGPGVDRSGDVLRHANFAGSSENGGVLLLAGDDHTCKSSTTSHQSEYAFVDAHVPVLNPAGVQEFLDYGIIGWAMSRYSGCWVAMKTVAETVDTSASVYVDPHRVELVEPTDFDMPEGGLNIRWPDTPQEQEYRLERYKLYAAIAFARANGIDRTVIDSSNARLGIATCGKSYLDVRQALEDLNIDEADCERIGIRIYKVGMTWPLDRKGILNFAEARLKVVGYESDNIKRRLAMLAKIEKSLESISPLMQRTPYFCSGCPHNTSTKVPEGSRAMAGIGCHYMVQWMDRETETFTHMGAEGANWIGQSPFVKTEHIFQNIGDGTFHHSGSMAIRAAVEANANMTYKILFNDAVAMTGGQPPAAGEKPVAITADRITRMVYSEGVQDITVVVDDPDKYPAGSRLIVYSVTCVSAGACQCWFMTRPAPQKSAVAGNAEPFRTRPDGCLSMKRSVRVVAIAV